MTKKTSYDKRNQKLSKKKYDKELYKLQAELCQLQEGW